MADLLGIASSGLGAIQQALSTTGHNIANVNTEGYSRQIADFSTLPAQR
ncbi:MAG: flagellar basal body protein, partial [Gammaproteobacteria bacterium]|nr:flagellar basal body protein [Gammaproteobacteria bacterium]